MKILKISILSSLLTIFSCLGSLANESPLEIIVFLSAQKMHVVSDNEHIYEWDVSSGKKGKSTPPGTFKPQSLSKNHRSSIYNNAPMPFAIFYSGNYAIHGGPYEKTLGQRASNGCIRLSNTNASTLFEMVKAYGLHNVEIRIIP